MNIQFAPLTVSIQRRLQTLAAGAALGTMMYGGPIGLLIVAYMILYTHHWLEAILYLIWCWMIDRDTCDQGGRRKEWVRGWAWWRYVKDYFPTRLHRVPWVELDPKLNYLLCCFPHGIFPMGAFTAFSTTAGEFRDYFPNHEPHITTLKLNFLFPVLRELIYSLGMCSASAASLNWLLGYPGGGKAVALIIGGAEEAFYCRPGQYRIILKKRKGFVKIALRNGAPLVPVFSFGETDLFDQLPNPRGSRMRRFQEWVKAITGVAPIIPLGRGYLQYTFGMVPFRKPVFTVVGKPIEVKKTEYPTQKQIDDLHAQFMERLIELFEEQKHHYLAKPEEAKLFIE